VRDKSLSAFSTAKRERPLKNLFVCVHNRILQRQFPIRAPIENADGRGTRIRSKGWVMTKQEECLAQEREEIATRIAKFRATQEKFEREREQYFLTTMQNARKTDRPSFWS
jgi:hypothetical protein